jgi:hypothetical protein
VNSGILQFVGDQLQGQDVFLAELARALSGIRSTYLEIGELRALVMEAVMAVLATRSTSGKGLDFRRGPTGAFDKLWNIGYGLDGLISSQSTAQQRPGWKPEPARQGGLRLASSNPAPEES